MQILQISFFEKCKKPSFFSGFCKFLFFKAFYCKNGASASGHQNFIESLFFQSIVCLLNSRIQNAGRLEQVVSQSAKCLVDRRRDILQIEIFAVNSVKKFVACAAVASSVGNYLANIYLPFVRKPLDDLPDARNAAHSAFDHIWHVAAQRQQKINI